MLAIIPPVILENIARNGSSEERDWALDQLSDGGRLRGHREAIGGIAPLTGLKTGGRQRAVFDASHHLTLPGKIVRSEKDKLSGDSSVNEAFDGCGATYDFYRQAMGRNSIDDGGMRLDSSVHYGRKYANAFWNGRQMVYGDGDGRVFNRFTIAIDVIGHELTHGVTQYEAALAYDGQPGALNEHFSDVFGALIKQYTLKQTSLTADWLIGAGLFTKKIRGVAIRSMKAPGTAYDDPLIGKDDQPGHMKDYVTTHSDHGGVHRNSGIPNRAFYETATLMGGPAWDVAGKVWYITLRDRLRENSDFAECAAFTYAVAGELYRKSGKEQKAVREGWKRVGISVS